MPDLLDRLKTALADRYAIEREIGAGGMARRGRGEPCRHGSDHDVIRTPPVPVRYSNDARDARLMPPDRAGSSESSNAPPSPGNVT